MADPVSITLGVIPLVGGVVKTYSAVYSKLKIFRHYSTKVQRVQKKFKFQRRVFENECHLLLRFAIDDDEIITLMKSDPLHEYWAKKDLDDKLKLQLDQNYDSCAEIVQDIRKAVEQLEQDLRCFDVLEAQQRKGERLKETAKRVQDGVRVAFNKPNYDKAIEDLRNSNGDLKGLREQITELQTPRQQRVQTRCRRPLLAEWGGHCKVRKASKALHEALAGAWSCGQANHQRHLAKLLVETGRSDNNEVQMNLAIICPANVRSPLQASLLQLHIRSQNLDWPEMPRLLSPAPSPDSSGERPRKRAKVVRFMDAREQRGVVTQPSTSSHSKDDPFSSRQLCMASCDLRCSKDICSDLARRAVPSTAIAGCLGHIDVRSEENVRHSFYPLKEDLCQGASRGIIYQDDIIATDQILDFPVDEHLSIVDRLQLARSLVSAVLKFHSTPWMTEVWRLGDLSFFRRAEDLSGSLRTLHLGVEFVQNKQIEPGVDGVRLTPSSSRLSQASEDDRLFCGINNMTLHSLGVALLQIGRWTRVEPEDVLKVRKMAVRGSTLGPRYQELTQKCLSCDFGYGSDLMRPQLHKAVYDNVMGVLEDMISSLDLNSDD